MYKYSMCRPFVDLITKCKWVRYTCTIIQQIDVYFVIVIFYLHDKDINQPYNAQ